MDFSFLLRGIFSVLVGVVCYYFVAVYRELKVIRKGLERIEKHLELTNEAESKSANWSFSDGTTFEVRLKNFGSQKIPVVKEVRTITGLGLRKTKEVVESAPVIIQKRMSRTEAENAKERLESLGAVVEIVQTQLV